MTSFEIDILDETDELKENDLNIIRKVLETAMTLEETASGAEVSVSIVNDNRIQELNLEYRDKDKPTDVLSFALNEGEEQVKMEGMPDMLGDIVISLPAARRQALEYGHSFEREIAFLSVHGFLHLTGYDHGNDEEEKQMFTRQEEILSEHGIKK